MKYVKSITIFGEYMNKSLELNFWPILYDSIVFLSLQTQKVYLKRNLTFRMGQKIKLQTLVQIFTTYRRILHILYFTR